MNGWAGLLEMTICAIKWVRRAAARKVYLIRRSKSSSSKRLCRLRRLVVVGISDESNGACVGGER